MAELGSTSEIVESSEDIDSKLKEDEKSAKYSTKLTNTYSIEDDINRLFEAIDVKSPAKGLRLSHEIGKDALWKKAMKRPMRVGSPQASGIGISEHASLKQALRGLCISQASEMAAMKRLSRPASSSEAGTIKKLYRAVVVEANESGLPFNEANRKLVKISLVPEGIESSQMAKTEVLDKTQTAKTKVPDKTQMAKTEVPDKTGHSSQDQGVPLPIVVNDEIAKEEPNEIAKAEPQSLQASASSATCRVNNELHGADDNNSALFEASCHRPTSGARQYHSQTASVISTSTSKSKVGTSAYNSARFIKPIFRSKNTDKKKVKQDLFSFSRNSPPCTEGVTDGLEPNGRNLDSKMLESTPQSVRNGDVKYSPASSNAIHSTEINLSVVDSSSSKVVSCSSLSNTSSSMLTKVDERSRSREKGELSQSSKSSIGDYSSSTSMSEDSNLTASSHSGNRPHMSRDLRWEAIRHVQRQHGSICLKHFKLVKKLGCGDIGSVYLAELTGTNCLFALKVMDNEFLTSRKKMLRAETEREILQMLDHPFLPTLYAHFISERLSCLVMEYCSGGDLHVLRQKQLSRSFPEEAARFYVAEVLLALEYLHMLGVVYRDLKPENILVREDGHIMLTDFDLSLRCAVKPVVIQSSSPVTEPSKKTSSPCSDSSCIHPFCLHPAWQVSCFTPRLISVAAKSRRLKSDLANQVSPFPQLVVEPTSARSNSFVGTHEYLAPEIIKGEGHGSAVDWWTFGIFLFELLYGRTPFKGSGNEETLSNVVSKSLKFPNSPVVSFNARDLIRGLLIKDPENRLGSMKGAAEIKHHSFFEGLNWALVRCAVPPELPKSIDVETGSPTLPLQCNETIKCKDSKSVLEEQAEFEMF